MNTFSGKNNFLYLGSPQEVQESLLGKFELSSEAINNWITNEKQREESCAALGAKYMTLVCPDKQSVYPEFLPGNISVSKHRYIDKVIEHSSSSFIYPLEELLAHKNICELYMNGDTHWNDVGAAIAFNALAEKAGIPSKIEIDEKLWQVTIGKGDLCVGKFSNVENKAIALNYPVEITETWCNKLAGGCAIAIYENSNKNLPTVLCFSDSYINTKLKLFASLFSKVIRVSSVSGEWFFEYFKNKKMNFDFVISEIVERNISLLIKSPAATNFFDKLKNNILGNVYSDQMLKNFKVSLTSPNSIHNASEKLELEDAIFKYKQKVIYNYLSKSDALSRELKKLDCLADAVKNKSVGSAVMNCNPFTMGHKYLISKASNKVDLLFVFVVQEDKSYFPFLDRLLLVLKGTNEFENVVVIPGGNFIISNSTFPDYFGKDTAQDICIDASNDLEIFSKFIAPKLGIGTRFVGNEPFCAITNQYNQQMERILPEYGVKVVVLDRVKSGDIAISASRVRGLL